MAHPHSRFKFLQNMLDAKSSQEVQKLVTANQNGFKIVKVYNSCTIDNLKPLCQKG